MTLGLVLSTGDARDLSRAAGIARAARRRGVGVAVFLMDRAVTFAGARAVTELVDEGCDVVACATSVDALRATPVPHGVTLGSQDDHAAIVQRADRVVAFT